MMKLSQRVAHERLAHICFIDYDREMVLVAERSSDAASSQIIAVGRLTKLHGDSTAEFAVVVSDPYQGHGLGREIVRRLLQIARNEAISRVTGQILPDNSAMQAVCRKLGFELTYDPAEGVVTADASVQTA
jgi:acetyltransferase